MSRNHKGATGRISRRICRAMSKRNFLTLSLTCYNGFQRIDPRRRKPLSIDGWSIEPFTVDSLGRNRCDELTRLERFRIWKGVPMTVRSSCTVAHLR